MINPLTIELSPDMIFRVFHHQLHEAIKVSEHELSFPDCHEDDSIECRRIIDASKCLLECYFGEVHGNQVPKPAAAPGA